jgi:hypothetical protein
VCALGRLVVDVGAERAFVPVKLQSEDGRPQSQNDVGWLTSNYHDQTEQAEVRECVFHGMSGHG